MPSDYQRICQDNIRRRGEEFDDIGHLISEQLYSDRSHFVFELLQNAEDALERRFRLNPEDNSSCKVHFRLFPDRLEFRHFGSHFNEKDVRGISDILRGTKGDDFIQIGKFGIGFKSVYAFTASPEIHSGQEHFVIKRYIRPESKNPEFLIENQETAFNFPFDHKELSPKDAFDLILNKLRGLGARVLLFLRRINEIEWCVEPGGERGQYLKEATVVSGCKNARRIVVIGQNNGKEEEENWLIFERTVPIPDGSNQIRVEAGFQIEARTQDKAENIIKVKNAPLIAYFPTEKDTRFGFLIQGPYKTTPSRDNISRDDVWNTTLVRETAHLITNALPSIKELGLLTTSFLEALPIRIDDFSKDSILYPIVSAVQETLMNQDLLPADDGTYVSAQNAKLASAEWLRKLLRDSQLKLIYRKEVPLKWISGEVTDRSKHDLWRYIRDVLGVEEVTPDSFARKLDSRFFTKQTDEWFIEFYKQLLTQKALWKKASNSYWDNPGPLRSKPFIRLQNNGHVKPFRDDDSPNAYLPTGINNASSLPIVKSILTEPEDSRRFLSDLGIPDLDVIAEVIEYIIPKYSSSSLPVSYEEHNRDIEKIQLAFKTDSQEKRLRLKKALQDTAFILSNPPDSKETAYRKPSELCFQDDAVMEYFSGNASVGFVSSDYKDSALEIFKDLGVSEDIRVNKRSPDSKGHIKIRDWHGSHVRGLNGFDPDIQVEGLEHALASPSIGKGALIWNRIAAPNFFCIRGTIEKSSRQTYEPCKREERISEFGRLLMENPWLPGQDGAFYAPKELRLEDLPDSFERNGNLADHLGMKRDIVALLAEKVGIRPQDIDLIREYPEEFVKWKEKIAIKVPSFPTRKVENPERRIERLVEQIKNSPEKKYEPRTRSIRVTEATEYVRIWLKAQYTNDKSQMICQICKEEMPFKKRDGEYYFEAVEALSKDHFPSEHEAQFLALCPLCAARYKELVKKDERFMANLRETLLNSKELEVPLLLGNLNTSLRFVETHHHDIKAILGCVE